MDTDDTSVTAGDPRRRPTIGVLTNRQIYIGTTIGRYEQMLFQGIRAAAHTQGCNLLLACGLGPDAVPYEDLPAWPSILPHTNFVPVGPWNTSGLIAIPPFSEAQLQSLHELKRHPATAHLPVLMVALNPNDDHGALLELDYLMKPLAPEQLTYVLEQRDPDDPTAARTILVVDDDPDIRALHTRLIRQQQPQCRVVQARNGREALALMERERPDLVLLDLMMPELDGFGVLAAMRERPALRDVPVVVLTAQTLTEDDMVRLNRGVAAILSKSLFSSDEILHHIEATLGHQRKRGSAMQLVVRRAVAFIQAHYQEALTRDQLAEHLTVSADHLTASFREEMGVMPIAYLNQYRISRACVLLAETGRSITDIALSVGFTDHPSFSRLFHREMGRTPHTFRREQQHKA